MDVLLGIDIIVDICSEKRLKHSSSTRAFNHAMSNDISFWIYTGSVPSIFSELSSELFQGDADSKTTVSKEEAEKQACSLLKEFCKDHHWLAALAEDGDVFDDSVSPGDIQLLKALDRLGEGAILLTNRNDLLSKSSKVCLTDDFVSFVEKQQSPKVPFIDLVTQQKRILRELECGIHKVLRHGQYILGSEVQELEEKLVGFTGSKHAITCSSGTDALLIPLMAYGVKKGDAIFTSPFTFIATAEVISLLGATPVFVDIDPQTFNLDPDKLSEKINEVKSMGKLNPLGVIAVDIFGLPADYDRIMAVAKENDLFVLEDAAQSFGGEYKGAKVGSLGHVAATSFFPAKPLGCYGDGGAIFTDDDELAEKILSIRVHGKGMDKYDNIRIGVNGRLDTIQAAILLPKLAIFADEIKARQQVAKLYSERIKDLTTKIKTPFVPQNYNSAWAQYSILPDDRDKVQQLLRTAGIPSAVYYPKPLHLQGAFSKLEQGEGVFPIAESISKKIISLPMNPYLKENQIDKVVSVLGNL